MKCMRGLLTALALVSIGAVAQAADNLPAAVSAAVKKAFPAGRILDVERERESGVRYYEVELDVNDNRIEVEVDSEGGIGEVERRVGIDEVPEALAAAILKAVGPKGKVRIERHERWGVGRGGRFVKLDKPRLFFEVKLTVGGKKREIKWRPASVTLPDATAKALLANYAKAIVTQVKKLKEGGVDIYRITLVQNGQDLVVDISAAGVIIRVDSVVALKDVPRAAVSGIKKAASGASVRRLVKVTRLASVKDGKTVPLDPAVQNYGALLRKGLKAADLEVSPAGQVLGAPAWRSIVGDEDFEDDDEDDEDDD
jgi:peptidase YpeB-like protein/putative PepSY-like beta-lactamase-inhibitor